jgi:hypothetical protein
MWYHKLFFTNIDESYPKPNIILQDLLTDEHCPSYNIITTKDNIQQLYFKKDNPSKVNNYRPISLISVLGKVMGRCIYKHVYNFLLNNSIITPTPIRVHSWWLCN